MFLAIRGSSSKCDSLASLFASVKMSIIVVISWSILEKDDWLFVKQFSVVFVPSHIFEECDVVFNLAFCIQNIVRFAHIRKLVGFAVVVLESNFVLLCRVYAVGIIWSWCSSAVLFLCF